MSSYTLTGRGVQHLSATVTRLFFSVTAFPGNLKFGSANPTNYYHMGLIRSGVNGFFANTWPLEGLDTFLDLPSGTTDIGYAFAAGVSCTVIENTSPTLAIACTSPVTGTTVSHVGLALSGTSSDVYPTAGTGYSIAADYGYASTLGGSTTYVGTAWPATVLSSGNWTLALPAGFNAGHSFWNFFPYVTEDGSTQILASNTIKIQVT